METLRRFFSERGFVEIDTPLVVPSPGLELHLDAFAVETNFLITSPEYQLKRLLAAGVERVYSVCKCFRRGESGAHHNPEFTMVEWYRSPGDWEAIAHDVEELCARVVETIRGDGKQASEVDGRGAENALSYQGQPLDLSPPWQWLSVAEAMERWAGVTLDPETSIEALRARGIAAGHRLPPSLTAWDDLFFSIFLDAVDPHLGRGRGTILHHWPPQLAALSRIGSDGWAERFEGYAGGLELANGFGELLCPIEQRARFEAERDERRRRGLPVYPIDERFLAALGEGIPPSAGVALGVDRLVMLACDARALRDVVSFTSDEL